MWQQRRLAAVQEIPERSLDRWVARVRPSVVVRAETEREVWAEGERHPHNSFGRRSAHEASLEPRHNALADPGHVGDLTLSQAALLSAVSKSRSDGREVWSWRKFAALGNVWPALLVKLAVRHSAIQPSRAYSSAARPLSGGYPSVTVELGGGGRIGWGGNLANGPGLESIEPTRNQRGDRQRQAKRSGGREPRYPQHEVGARRLRADGVERNSIVVPGVAKVFRH